MLFILNRETGEPLFPVEERKVPASQIPGEEAWPTQPFTTAPPPLSPHHFDIEKVWGLTDEDRASCRAAIEGLRFEGVFTPPDTRGTLQIPSSIGGAHWGGVAVDPERQIAVVPVNRAGFMVQLIPREEYDRDRNAADDERLGHNYEYNMMKGTPYVMRRRLLLGPSGLPCTPPPWGALVGVNLQAGTVEWEVPLGSAGALLQRKTGNEIASDWGSPNLGGPIITAGGVVFIGASLDHFLKAYDVETGNLLWRGPLPAAARATPMSYELKSGDQFVVIAVGGGGVWGRGDHLVAFRLPDDD
jgi:quinoprotein glucose dehydrogenase